METKDERRNDRRAELARSTPSTGGVRAASVGLARLEARRRGRRRICRSDQHRLGIRAPSEFYLRQPAQADIVAEAPERYLKLFTGQGRKTR